MTWKFQNFIKYINGNTVMEQVADFLNEHKIEQFVVLIMKDDYIEIVYKEI